MGDVFGRAGEPLFGGLAAAIDLDIGKLGDKRAQELLDAVGADLRFKPGERPLHDLGVVVLAVVGDERVADLVDESHGEERGGVDGRGGIVGRARTSLIRLAIARLAATSAKTTFPV